MSRFSVVICGGGVAGFEALLRLRHLAHERIDVTLVTPGDELVYRPLAVREPFEPGWLRRYPVARIVEDTGAEWVRDSLAWVDRAHQIVHTGAGTSIGYDALLLAVGGRQVEAEPGVLVFSDRTVEQFSAVLDDVLSGAATSVVFAEPAGPNWPFPLYELALQTANRARTAGRLPEITMCTPDPRPLAAFGTGPGDVIAELLDQARIMLHTGATVHPLGQGRLLLRPAGIELRADHVVSVPRVTGPNVRGIPGDPVDRFLHVDTYCRVLDTGGRIFAAGDATQLQVKQGAVGAQQADCAAEGIVHLAGLGERPGPLRPVIRGMFYAPSGPLYLSAHLIAGHGWRARISRTAPWPVDDKIVAQELGPYLAGLEPLADHARR